jgi:periplasmic divalent cation tolerance protein
MNPSTQSAMGAEFVVVLCTAPATASAPRLGAHDLALQLVEDRLCACVNVLPGIVSYYRWQGAVEAGHELLLVAKTTAANVAAVRARLAELHPYEVPEVVALPIVDGNSAYFEWLRGAVQPEPRA